MGNRKLILTVTLLLTSFDKPRSLYKSVYFAHNRGEFETSTTIQRR